MTSLPHFDRPSLIFFSLKIFFSARNNKKCIFYDLREARLEIPEQDPLFLNTDLVSSRGLCVCEPNINIKAESVAKLCRATGGGLLILLQEYSIHFLYSWILLVFG